MSCCSEQTREQFLIEKAKNFRAFIMKYEPDDEVKAFMNQFNEENVISTAATILTPLKALGTIDLVITDLMGKIKVPAEEAEAVRVKIGRYIDLFLEV